MTARRYRKKPVVIDALQFTGTPQSAAEAAQWIGDSADAHPDHVIIHTLEGDMRADAGDWIIRGVKGEFYPCKPDVFERTYEAAD